MKDERVVDFVGVQTKNYLLLRLKDLRLGF